MLCGYIGKILFVEFSCGNIQEEALGEKTCLSLNDPSHDRIFLPLSIFCQCNVGRDTVEDRED